MSIEFETCRPDNEAAAAAAAAAAAGHAASRETLKCKFNRSGSTK